MTLDEARALVGSPLWPKVRDRFLATGEFALYPKGDYRRIEYLDDDMRRSVSLWLEALDHAAEWRTVVDGERVRELSRRYRGVYPEVFRYQAYFAGLAADDRAGRVKRLLKLRFPDAYSFCFEEELQDAAAETKDI